MKITNEHLEHMREAIAPLDTTERREAYKLGELSSKRHRWDLAREAGLIPFVCATLYKYLDDTHIDTALRNIVPAL